MRLTPSSHFNDMPTLDEILSKGSASFRRLNGGLAGAVPANPSKKSKPNRAVVAAAPNPKPEPLLQPALDSGTPAETESYSSSLQRPIVLITLYRVALLDPDNKYGSCKKLIDAIRGAGLIPNDREEDIELKVEQVRVRHRKLEGTGISITYRNLSL